MKRLPILILWLTLATSALADPAATGALNGLRDARGVPPVVYSERLAQVALAHARDMARQGTMTHTGSNGSTVGQRVRRAGYRWCYVSENVAMGYRSLERVLNAWAASPGHYRNMVNRKAREFGMAQTPDRFWVMVLAAPC